MSKKRDQIQRRRQVAKARKGTSAPASKAVRPPVAKKEQKTSMTDVWIAVGIVVLILGAFAALYYFAVVRPANRAETLQEITVQAPTAEAAAAATQAPGAEATEAAGSKSWAEPPAMAIDPSKNYEALIKTEKGDIRIQLYADQTPVTVNNFVFLAREGFYDGVTFHRVLENFMAQTGDPTGTGRGGPGYQFEDEIVDDLKHDSEGIVSMANSGPNTNGSQFFITFAPQPHLDGQHTVFGKVIEGLDVARSLTLRDPQANPDAPAGDRIISVEIIES